MKKFAANYLMNHQGDFLKNGIVVAEDDGTVLQYIDTSDNLIEIAGLIFHNGILMAGFSFQESDPPITRFESDSHLSSMVWKAIQGLDRFSAQNLIDLAKVIQENFQQMNIPEIMNEIIRILISKAGFTKEYRPGIFLLKGTDLPRLRFTSNSKLKRIL